MCVGWIVRVWDNGGRNIKVGQAEFFDMRTLCGDCSFSMEDFTFRKGIRNVFESLAEAFIKR